MNIVKLYHFMVIDIQLFLQEFAVLRDEIRPFYTGALVGSSAEIFQRHSRLRCSVIADAALPMLMSIQTLLEHIGHWGQ
jgi:hypothetical protein